MEPEPILPTPREATPTIAGGAEAPSLVQAQEKIASSEQVIRMPQIGLPVTAQPIQPVAIPVVQDTTSLTSQTTVDSPAIADDVEVIEKEWVDKAKKIVLATRDDPHKQEKEVNKLQADYLMKRYGKQIKLVD